MRGIKLFLVVLLLIVGGFGFYWGKCQLGVDIIDGFSWESHFSVLKVFQKEDPVIHPQPGEVLIQTSFDQPFSMIPWGKAYTGKRELIKEQVVEEGRTGEHSLMIEDLADDFWVKEYSHWVAVKAGDRFAYSGFVRPEGEARVYMGITLYDVRKHTVNWNSAGTTASADKGTGWRELSSQLVVPEGVKFIRFRVSGEKLGQVYFDDIKFWKEK